jgi:hypothetical protein
MCVALCGYRCYPDVFEDAGGTMRSCRTHISGLSSLILRRASATYPLGTPLTESSTKSQRRLNLLIGELYNLAEPLLAFYFLDLKAISSRRSTLHCHHGSNERVSRSECAIQKEPVKCHRLSCCAVHFLFW